MEIVLAFTCLILVLAGICGATSAQVTMSFSNPSPEVGESVEMMCAYRLADHNVANFLYVDTLIETDDSWQEMFNLNTATNATGGLYQPKQVSITSSGSGGSLTATLSNVNCSARYKCQLSLRAGTNTPMYTQMPLVVKGSDGYPVPCDSHHLTYSLGIVICTLAMSLFN